LEGLHLYHLSMTEHVGTFFEGFFSLYMISRHEFAKSFIFNFVSLRSYQKV
jgi:hypothetical protein